MSIYTQAGFKDKLDYQTYCAGQAGCPLQYVIDGTVGIDNLQYIYDYAFTYTGGGSGPTPPPVPSGNTVTVNDDYAIKTNDTVILFNGTVAGKTLTLPTINNGTSLGVSKNIINIGTVSVTIARAVDQPFNDELQPLTYVLYPKNSLQTMPLPNGAGYMWS